MAKLQPFKDQMYKLMENQPDLPNDELVRRFANIGLNAATVRRWVSRSFWRWSGKEDPYRSPCRNCEQREYL